MYYTIDYHATGEGRILLYANSLEGIKKLAGKEWEFLKQGLEEYEDYHQARFENPLLPNLPPTEMRIVWSAL